MVTVPEAITLAVGHHRAGRFRMAEDIYRRILEVDPTNPDALHLLGVLVAQTGNYEAAVASIARALELRPGWPEAQINLGNALRKVGKADESACVMRQAVQLMPGAVEAWNNLGNALKDLGEADEAISCYRRALELRPEHASAHYNLGIVLRRIGRLDEAISCYRRALELRPDDPETWNNLGNAFKDQGDLDNAIAGYRRSLELSPEDAEVHSNLLYTLHYCPGVTPEDLALAHDEFDRWHASHFAPVGPPPIDRARTRPRLGFVSPDFVRHPVSTFFVRALEGLARTGLETFCYSNRLDHDDMTDRLRAAATGWHEVAGLSHERLAAKIRGDGIDILFDLAGHSARNRLLTFARRPAPILVTWLGYEGTTGLSAMDYLLADGLTVPPEDERYYRERILRMPLGYLCYDPPAGAPAVGPPPCLANGFVTFGGFGNPAKITAEVVSAWSRVLLGSPGSRLVMKYRGLSEASVRDRYFAMFAAHGVGPERLDLLPGTSYDDYLATYARVDLALDPFPFSGSMMTCESLWMGVPVITLPGQTFASRHSLVHLTSLGLTELIARNVDEYVNLAISTGDDAGRLTSLRGGLRERMARSPMCDGDRFAADLASILIDLWANRRG
jgi:protein O-GlcNAc transferase